MLILLGFFLFSAVENEIDMPGSAFNSVQVAEDEVTTGWGLSGTEMVTNISGGPTMCCLAS